MNFLKYYRPDLRQTNFLKYYRPDFRKMNFFKILQMFRTTLLSSDRSRKSKYNRGSLATHLLRERHPQLGLPLYKTHNTKVQRGHLRNRHGCKLPHERAHLLNGLAASLVQFPMCTPGVNIMTSIYPFRSIHLLGQESR